MLVRGVLIFLVLALLIALGILSVEYFLWLGKGGRLALLLSGLAIEGYLLFRFILIPLLYLFRIRKGLSNKQASLLIGMHFPEVGDKLYNLLDLADDRARSELLLASIDQRSRLLTPVPFSHAIGFREAVGTVRYLCLPIAVVLLLWVSGSISDFFGSYERVVNYDVAYLPPAPFVFEPVLGDLEVLESETVTVQVRTSGEVRPEDMSIIVSGREHLMQKERGIWQYTFHPPLQSAEFYFSANGERSESYDLIAHSVPAIVDFEMELDYPSYLNRKRERIRSTGNAVFPEGTKVNWKIKSKNTERIYYSTKDTSLAFEAVGGQFALEKVVFQNTGYSIKTSNDNIKEHEVLNYVFTVIRDKAPEIRVKETKDTLNPGFAYYAGEASDDHKVSDITLVVYPEGRESETQKVRIAQPGTNFERFYYTFPSGIEVQEGVNYEYFFTVTDNDAIHNGKTSRSQIFRMGVLSERELQKERLQSQEELLRGMNTTFEEFKEQKEEYRAISKTQKEKNQLNYTDQTQLRDFLERQKQQEEMMENFSLELKKNLEESESDQKMNGLLQERLERQEQEARKNAKLLEELKKVADKIDKEELSKRLEEIGKQRQSNERSLQQLLELTKRYYVTEKAAQLARELEKLANEQKALSDNDPGPEPSRSMQKELVEKFENQVRELDTLRSDNKDLKRPLTIAISTQDEESVKSDQKSALEELQKSQEGEENKTTGDEKGDKDKIKKNQQNAGQKMQEMSEKLQQASSSGDSDSGVAEDARMLRQILDNLITFSFKQEQLFEKMEREGGELGNYTAQVREQQKLRELFGHIDDSLFALSLRRAEISEVVNGQITEVYYNIDKALESVSESRIFQGISHQQYVFSAANTLADFLADVLDNMQQSLAMGSGQGSSDQGFQLPDIIRSQGQLGEQMGKEGQKGEKEGSSGEKGEGKEDGNSDGDGQSGEGQKEGSKDGSGNTNGRDGKQGQSASGSGDEEELKEIYEIYKQQQLIREALEQQLEDMLEEKDRLLARRILRQMENFENELLKQGITERTISRVNQIEHELLKMENAALKQGKKEERESKSNREQYRTPILTKPREIENYDDEIEILNRQALPLRQIFQTRVKEYFEEHDKIPLSD
jgi:hypothetical protein